MVCVNVLSGCECNVCVHLCKVSQECINGFVCACRFFMLHVSLYLIEMFPVRHKCIGAADVSLNLVIINTSPRKITSHYCFVR
jgi:hypothetical protein